jgi:uncharacterized protein
VTDLLNPLAGFLVGVLVGFTGVGGGALMTPLLVLLFGVAPQTAVGTDLLFASATKAVGGWVHGRRGSIDWVVLLRLASGSVPAAALTVLLLHYSPQHAGLRAIMLPALGAALLLTCVAMFFQARLHGLGERLRASQPARFARLQLPLTVVAGAPQSNSVRQV